MAEDICQVMDKALAAYNTGCGAWRAKLAEDIAGRADTIERTVGRVETQSPQTVSAYRERLEKQDAGGAGLHHHRRGPHPDGDSHLCRQDRRGRGDGAPAQPPVPAAGSCCGGMNPWAGRLDFLIQEINRECNTIGSKCNDLTITQDVVNMKAEVEKIREQVQNIE